MASAAMVARLRMVMTGFLCIEASRMVMVAVLARVSGGDYA